MIKVKLTNEIIKRISAIDENRFSLNNLELPKITTNKLHKNPKKKSSYASNKIEGNPLSEQQAEEAIDFTKYGKGLKKAKKDRLCEKNFQMQKFIHY